MKPFVVVNGVKCSDELGSNLYQLSVFSGVHRITELARLFPKEDVPNRVRKLPVASSDHRLGDEVHSGPQLLDDSVRTAVQARDLLRHQVPEL